MDYKKSLQEFEKIIIELKNSNRITPIIVEGEKDIFALHQLDIKGLILTINSGASLTDFCDKIANEFKEIILLTDLDRRGGYLCHKIKKNLEGRVKCNIKYRELLAKNTTIKTIEGLPSWITTIEEKNKKTNK